MFWFDVLRLQIANLTLICYKGLPLKCLGAIIKTITLIFRKFLSGSTFPRSILQVLNMLAFVSYLYGILFIIVIF